uniref:Uncharacterized protein n=1 Tax=Moschus moschiferus TaxID=68415 RepID=A0A8C6DM48_MOSMO
MNFCCFRARGCQTTHSSRTVLRSCSLCHQTYILGAGLVDTALVFRAHFDVRGRWVSRSEAELLQILLEAWRLWEKMPEALGEVHAGHSSSDVAVIEMHVPSSLAHRLAAQTLPGTARRLLHRGSTRLSYGETCVCHLAAPPSTGSTCQRGAVQTAARSTVEMEAAICCTRKMKCKVKNS